MSKMTFLAVGIVALGGAATAQTIASWNLSGATGDQGSTTGTNTPNITANALTRGPGLTGVAAANSMNASGWDVAGRYFSFGFNVASGFSVNLKSLYIGTRSSGTGPGLIGLYYNGDGFTTALTTFNQAGTPSGTGFLNTIVNLSSLTGLTGNVEFRLRAIGTGSAAGGTTGSAGTFRVTAYFVGGAFDRDLQFTGTVVPTPAALMGIAGLVGIRRRR